MRAVLDACVLYPTILREICLGVAKTRHLAPVWSDRILEEWRRAALRVGGPVDGAFAEGEIARANAAFPDARQASSAEIEVGLWLPDADDIHVLATAVASGAPTIITLNLRDFPVRELSAHDITAIHPDAFLYALWLDDPDAVTEVVHRVHAATSQDGVAPMALRPLLKRAKLPRLGKALG